MNPLQGDGWRGSRKGGRPRVDKGLRLDSPMRIRFSGNDIDWIGQAMTIESAENFSQWARDTLVRHARRTILKERNTRS